MAYSQRIAAALSGATIRQLGYWRKDPALLVPEVSPVRPILYSFRDVVALRAFVCLRERASLQAIRDAVANLDGLGEREHLSAYTLLAWGNTVYLRDTEEALIELSARPWQLAMNLGDLIKPFDVAMRESFPTARVRVPDLLRPRRRISVDPDVLGGAPVIADTRIPFEMVASLVRDNVPPAEIKHFWPSVSADAARDAASFADYVDLFDPASATA
jgi:uncharacterized protein (DUF433 family)